MSSRSPPEGLCDRYGAPTFCKVAVSEPNPRRSVPQEIHAAAGRSSAPATCRAGDANGSSLRDRGRAPRPDRAGNGRKGLHPSFRPCGFARHLPGRFAACCACHDDLAGTGQPPRAAAPTPTVAPKVTPCARDCSSGAFLFVHPETSPSRAAPRAPALHPCHSDGHATRDLRRDRGRRVHLVRGEQLQPNGTCWKR